MRLTQNTPEQVTIELDWAEDLCTVNGMLHSGKRLAKATQTQAVLQPKA